MVRQAIIAGRGRPMMDAISGRALSVKGYGESGVTDEILLTRVRDYPNGEYVTWICRKCGAYSTSPEAYGKEPKIIDLCMVCATI